MSRIRVHPQRDLTGEPDDAGFTLVEIMVVLLILAILLAIAIPTFLGTTAVATARSAQANLNTAFTDAKTQYESDNQTYYVNGVQVANSAGFAGLLNVAQLSLTFVAGNAGATTLTGSSGSSSVVSVSVSADGNGLVMANYAKPGSCFYLVDNNGGISSSSSAVAPYTGATAVTTSPVVAPAGTIGLPTGAGVSYVSVLGDYNANDCNANSPLTGGSPATVQYLTSHYPS